MDEIKAKETKPKKKNIKKMFAKYDKYIVIVLIVCLLGSILFLCKETTKSSRFYRDLVRGLSNGWEISSDEMDVQIIEGKKQTEFIMKEYEAVSIYKNENLSDRAVEKYAQEYIFALEGCKAAIESYNSETQYETFWQEFSPYYGKRIQCLNNLYKIDSQVFDDVKKKYPEKFNRLILNGWAIDKTANIHFEKKQDEKGMELYQAEILNDSEIDMEYFNLEIELLTKEQKVVDTISAYVQNWQKNTKKTLQFYKTSNKVRAYRIKGVTCK